MLRSISRDDGGLTISDLSRRLGLGKSTVHGIAAALEAEGALVRDPLTKRFRLGLTLLELGRSAYARIYIKDAARPFMETLMVKTRESVFLGVRNDDRITILDIVESMQELKITSPIGTTIPLLAGATGKIFLAHMDETEARDLVRKNGLHPYTAKTITDPRRYLEQVNSARLNAYAVDDEEYISGVRAVAAPVQAGDRLLGAVWVVGFTPGLNDSKMAMVIAETQLAAAGISNSISQRTGN